MEGPTGSYILGIFMNQEWTILHLPKTPEMFFSIPAANSDKTLGRETSWSARSVPTLCESVPFKRNVCT